ncbi:MAG: PQQ-binding-like beta-propeller repeat protein [Pseudomonadota bacterium]|nr:PQQ-binding-like beta-propeller repeat protein [Pseudomonadota bacterium]
MFLSAITGICLAAHTPGFEPLWRHEGFDSPESVITDGRGGYFVSNVNGGGGEANGEGYLTRLDADGAVIGERRWADGLNAPKGLAMAGGRLFVTDIDSLVAIDPEDGRILQRYTVEGARFLNDAAAHDGRILVSDSGTGRIYVLDGDTVSLWLEDQALAGINGLWPEADRLLVTTMERGEILAIDWHTRSIKVLADGLPDADGIARTSGGGYVISQWPGDVWYWHEGEPPRRIFERRDPPVLMNDLTIVEDRVIIPHWSPGAVSAWQLTCPQDDGLKRK